MFSGAGKIECNGVESHSSKLLTDLATVAAATAATATAVTVAKEWT
jgi:hypothetical protein